MCAGVHRDCRLWNEASFVTTFGWVDAPSLEGPPTARFTVLVDPLRDRIMNLRRRRSLVVVVVLAGLTTFGLTRWPWTSSRGTRPRSPDGVFLVEPYVQLGDPASSTSERVEVLWQGEDRDADWSVET